MKTENEVRIEIILNYLNGIATQEEIKDLKIWLKDNSNNKRIFDEISDLWSATAVKSESEFNVWTGYQKVKAKLTDPKISNGQDNHFSNDRLLKLYRFSMRVAAVFIVLLVLGMFFVFKSKSNSNIINSNDNTITEISAPLGSKAKITLPDGTNVSLNAGSTIRYNSAFNRGNRTINLEGEAYFDVKKKMNHPFLVITPEITIKVLGTAFNVKAYPKEGLVETTLVRGALIVEQTKVNGDMVQTILAPRQRATLLKQNGKMLLSETETEVLKKERIPRLEMAKGKVLIASEIDTEIFTAWKDNRLIFRNETFESLSIKLERWYGVKIIFADNEIKNYHFNGTIENETINDVLDIVRLTLPIDYSILHNNIIITKLK